MKKYILGSSQPSGNIPPAISAEKPHSPKRFLGTWSASILATVVALATAWHAEAGTWAALANPPPAGLNNALLMSDGTVICGDGGQNWYRLTPDNHGSYVNGTWSQIASTAYTRLFYASQVLTNGNVLVAGGEYGTGRNEAELYNYLNNSWSTIVNPNNDAFSDCESKILPNGNVLIPPVGDFGGCLIYNVAANSLQTAASAANQNEAAWVRLPNDNIVTIDAFGQNSEHYVPSLNQWVADGNVPVTMYGYGGELGAGFVLPNGKAFFIGATNHTAIYTPGGSLTSAGSWVQGANIPNNLGAVDAPAATLVTGKILCAVNSTLGFDAPTYFYEYDYAANSFTQVNGPTGTTLNTSTFATSMLDLPDGNVLFISGQGTTSLYVYTPSGSPIAQGKPTVNSISQNGNGSYHLTGVGLNGISGGAAYGDDWQMDTSYPLVRLTNNTSGVVYYARTYNWSSTTIQNPNAVTTEFTLPAGLPNGTYSLAVAVNGFSSSPFTFTVGSSGGIAGTHSVINKSSGLALEDPGFATGNGTNMDQWTSNGGSNQKWTFTANSDGSYTLINGASGKALDDPGFSTANGTDIDQWTSDGGANQHWQLNLNSDGSYTILNASSGKALDDPGFSNANGTLIDQWTSDGGANQHWSLQ